MAGLHRIINSNDSMENITSSATYVLLQNYLPPSINFIFTQEQARKPYLVQILNNSVEKLMTNDFVKVVFLEVKTMVNSNFNDTLDQL